MCQNCTHARGQIAATLTSYHRDMMTVMGYAVLEATLDEYVNVKHPHLDDEERNRIVTDVTAVQGSEWTHEFAKALGGVLGDQIANGARKCESLAKGASAESARAEDLDQLMTARESMEQILTDNNVRMIIDELTDNGEDEES